MGKSNRYLTIAILLVVILLAVLPLAFIHGSEFGGSDDAAEEAVGQLAPDYEPWFQPIFEPPGAETESLLFALQAAIGAGVIGYAFGFFRGRSTKKGRTNEDSV
ncbi:energy-coupling factor ABC transporter substrate-binding protein [Brevibacillus massiliensis]|jgi:cobalt/nickel transport protein|uniref:energy-coupling factor ABC transporter substrate-binding protein n=1 Tax=Brevibacillus massiliensis TaxID=1118054 RepID=UPI0002DB1193|nr:energy-coupling factor ABC transporter substrate-binding protein [Brevibacillus massiliensis]